MVNVKDTIKDVVRYHLKEKNGLALGQCLTAVGWVGGTLPELYEEDGMVELSMADVAGGGIAVGMALANRRPMYVIRYQGFNWYNAPSIINYAAKSKEIWDISCPIFVRSIAMEGGIGPVAGSSHHSLYYRMPGIKIYSPMTPNEYKEVYKNFMNEDEVYYVSEHRGSYNNTEELPDIIQKDAKVTLLPISITRFAAVEAAKELEKEGTKVNIIHINQIKPFKIKKEYVNFITNGLVIDDDYVDGIAKAISYDIQKITNKKIDVLGLENKTAGFYKQVDNLPPTKEKIIGKIKKLLEDNYNDNN